MLISNKAVKKRKKNSCKDKVSKLQTFKELAIRKNETILSYLLLSLMIPKKLGGGDGALFMLTIQDRGLYEC